MTQKESGMCATRWARHRIWLLVALLLLWWFAAGCVGRSSPPVVHTPSGHLEQPIGRYPFNGEHYCGKCSEDGCQFACIEREQISRLRLLTSLGMATPAQRVWLDGKPSPWFEEIVRVYCLGRDEGFLFLARTGKRKLLYQNMRRIGTYDDVCSRVAFSRNGKTYAYAVRRGKQWYLVVNGSETPVPQQGEVKDLVLSPNGSQVAYVVEQGEKETLFVGRNRIGTFDEVKVFFVSDDGRPVYRALQGDLWLAVEGDRRYVERSGIGFLAVSDDGRLYGYVRRGNPSRLVWHGKLMPYGLRDDLEWSSDGKLVAYAAEAGDRCTVVVNGQPQGWYDDVEPIHLSEDGKHFAFGARQGRKYFVVFDGKRKGPFRAVGEEMVLYSRQSSPSPGALQPPSPTVDVAYLVYQDEGCFLVAGGRQYGPFHFPRQIVFRRDGAHFALIAGMDEDQHVVVDGKAGPFYDDIVAEPAFRRDGAVEYMAIRDGTLYRVTVPLP